MKKVVLLICLFFVFFKIVLAQNSSEDPASASYLIETFALKETGQYNSSTWELYYTYYMPSISFVNTSDFTNWYSQPQPSPYPVSNDMQGVTGVYKTPSYYYTGGTVRASYTANDLTAQYLNYQFDVGYVSNAITICTRPGLECTTRFSFHFASAYGGYSNVQTQQITMDETSGSTTPASIMIQAGMAVHAVYLLSLDNRFNKTGVPLNLNIRQKKGLNTTSISPSGLLTYTHPYFNSGQPTNISFYSIKLQVKLASENDTKYRNIAFRDYADNTDISIPYDTLIKVFGSESVFVGKECQIRIIQSIEGYSTATIPISYYYLPQLTFNSVNKVDPSCNGETGSVSVSVGNLPENPSNNLQFLYLLYSYDRQVVPKNAGDQVEFPLNSGQWHNLINSVTSGNVNSSDSTITVNNLIDGIYKLTVYILAEGANYLPAETVFEIKEPTSYSITYFSPTDNWNTYNVPTGTNSGRVTFSVTGGIPPYKYSFNPLLEEDQYTSFSGSSATRSAPWTSNSTPTTIYISDANNCPAVSAGTQLKRAPNGVTYSEIDDTIIMNCSYADGGSGTGEVDFSINGGVGYYNVWLYNPDLGTIYEYYNTAQKDYLFEGLDVGYYDLVFSDITGGSKTISFEVVEPEPYKFDSVIFADTKCFGDKTTATVYINTNNAHYSCWRYSSSEFYENTTGIFPGLTPGYAYIFSYDAACLGPSATYTATPNPYSDIHIDTVLTGPSCSNAGNGEALISAKGGAPYIFGGDTAYIIEKISPLPVWRDSNNVSVLTGLTPANTYTVRVTDKNGCQKSTTFSIPVSSDTLRISSLSSTDAYCSGNTNGALQVSINPGSRPANSYSYTLSRYNAGNYDELETFLNTDLLSHTFTGYGTETYRIEVEGADGCSFRQTDSIKIDPDHIQFPTGLETVNNTLCYGVNTGSISAGAQGGFPLGTNYYYTLDQTDGDFFTNDTVNGPVLFESLPEGTYNLIVGDGVGCYDTISNLRVDVEGVPVSFNELNVHDQYCDELRASLKVQAGSTSGSITSIVLTYPNNIEDTLSTGSYALKDSLLASSNSYTITATDAMGCKRDTSFIILNLQNNPQINLIAYDSVACETAGNGMFTFNSGQKYPQGILSYNLQGIEKSAIVNQDVVFSGLPKGDFSIHVEDTMGCSVDSVFTLYIISKPINIEEWAFDTASCIRAANGGVELTASGSMSADPGYYFVLNSQDTLYGKTVNFGGLKVGGANRIFVYDKFGCADNTATFQIPVRPDSLNLSVLGTTDASCPGYANGQINVQALNGNPFVSGFLYRLIDQSNQSEVINTHNNVLAEFSGIPSGTYNVEVSDSDNCLALSDEIVINEPSAPVLQVNPGYVAQKGDSTGWINALISSGNGRYFVEWYSSLTAQPSNLLASETSRGASAIASLPAGTYMVRVQDTAGCVFWDDEWYEMVVEVPEPQDSLKLKLQQLIPVSCNGLSNGRFILNAAGGWGNSYLFGNSIGDISSSVPEFDGLPAGTAYTFYVADTAGVIDSATFEMTEPEVLTASVDNIIDANCFGSSDGEVQLNIAGGNDIYYVSADQSNWVEGSQIGSLPAGDYTLYVRDILNCETNTVASVTEPTPLAVIDTVIENTQCQINEGRIEASVEGGSPGYNYSWYEGISLIDEGSPSVDSLYSGIYTLQVIDNHNCTQEFTFYITDLTDLEISSLTAEPVSCWEGSNGSASVEIQNGNPPYRIIWPDSTTSNTVSGLQAGVYLLSVYDAEGCKVFQNFSIGTPDSLSVQINSIEAPLCLGVANGSIEVSASGGTPGYSYSWSTGRNRNQISNINAGTYLLTVADNNNCTKSYSFEIGYTEQVTTLLPDNLKLCRDNSYILDPGNFEFYSWYQGDRYLSSEQKLNVDEAGEYVVEAEDSRGCQVTDTIVIGTSDTEMEAQFLMASVVYQYDTLIVFEASRPIPDSIYLFLDESLTIIDSGQYYRYLMPVDTGSFEITLVSYMNDCQDIITKMLTVLPADEKGDNFKSAGAQIINSAKLFPNPTDGNFSLELELNVKSSITLRLVSFGDGATLLIRDLKGSDYYFEPFKLEGLMPGIYLLSIQAGTEMRTLKVIVY